MHSILLAKDFQLVENAMADRDHCFILGNGATLNKINLSSLTDDVVIGCNRILFSGFTPTILCIGDKNSLYDEYHKQLIDSPCHLVVGIGVHNHLVHNLDFPSHRISKVVNYAPKSFYRYDYSEIYSKDLQSTFCLGNVVSDISIPLAAYLGFKKIYILGLDSYQPYANSWHFYEREETPSVKYFTWSQARYHQIWNAKQDTLARLQGIYIYNLTPGTAHLGFERLDLNDLFPALNNNDPLMILDHYLKFDDKIYRILPANNGDKSACSLQNVNNGNFLRHQCGIVKESQNDGCAIFFEDSSFIPEPSFVDKNLVSFRSCNINNYYITKTLFYPGYRIQKFNADFLPQQSSFEYFH